MSGQPPPPPPPHGAQGGARSGGLPPGKYDIFVIPEHSAGSGFLYLPSLQPNINSFVAGFASALILVVLGQSMAPAFRTWWDSFQGLGNVGVVMLIAGVGFGAWALGRQQNDGGSFGSNFKPKPNASSGGPGGSAGFGAQPGAAPHADGPPPPPPHGSRPSDGYGQGSPGGPPPHGARQHAEDWQSPPNDAPPPPQEEKKPPPPKPEPKKAEPPKSSWEKARDQYKGSWEKAREETRKKEEERKAKEAEQKRKDETAKRLAELRAKEAKERQARDMEKQKREKEAKDKDEKLKSDQRAKELLEKLEREKKEKERVHKEREEKAKKDKAEADSKSRAGGSYAFSGAGEKMSMWPGGRAPNAPKHSPTPSAASRNPPSPEKKPPAPTAKTYMSEETHSYRPYDQPKRGRKKSVSSYASESSFAPSHTTARTSPPPSMRGPYSTKDPDKICISAVYLFMNQFAKTPASQLISGIGTVTDGLILRITTEGLFIDDDVRGVPQREWDVKAWTLKQVEVWCPPHCFNSSSASFASATPPSHNPFKMASSRARNADRAGKALTGEEADVYLAEMQRACNDCCRLGLCERTFRDTNIPSPTGQTGEWKTKGLHVVRATLRDQEAKRYIFVIEEHESWKVAVGLQRLRKGTQVRQLGVSGMSPPEARNTLEMLGWG